MADVQRDPWPHKNPVDRRAERHGRSERAPRVLVTDNRDSFTHILAETFRAAGAEVTVRDHAEALGTGQVRRFDAAVISPGPGRPDNPEDTKNSAAVLDAGVPVLGVCLGHQLIAHRAGASVGRVEPVHGRADQVFHQGTRLFSGLPSPLQCVRYHSLAVTDVPPAAPLDVTARAADGTVMALAHRDRPWWGVQFHPESLDSHAGMALLANFLRLAAEWNAGHRPRVHRRLLSGLDIDAAGVFAALYADSPTAVWLDDSTGAGPSLLADCTGPRARRLRVEDGVTVVDGCRLDVDVFDFLADDCPGSLSDAASNPAAPDPAASDPAAPDATESACPFGPGWVGYLGYELKSACLPVTGRHQSWCPDAQLLFVDRGAVVQGSRIWLFAWDTEPDAWFDRVEAELRAAGPAPVPGRRVTARPVLVEQAGRAEYVRRIGRVQEWIRDGETYEACLTTRLRGTGQIDVGDYLRLRTANPSAWGSYLRFDGMQVLSTSPETFLTVDPQAAASPGTGGQHSHRLARSRPIKGTRPRGGNAAADARLRAGLAAAAKDRAENLMIVDLVRSDLARVSVPGGVRVPEAFAVESYATVHQLVSTVEAEVPETLPAARIVRAAFPGGSMTGAPKVRTVQLLDAVEDAARGVYSGVVGYFGYDGSARLAMVIRTLVACGEDLSYGAGGAVLALSDPQAEYDEVMAKSAALDPVADVEFPR